MQSYFIWMGANHDVIRFNAKRGWTQADADAYMTENYPERMDDAWGWGIDDNAIEFGADQAAAAKRWGERDIVE